MGGAGIRDLHLAAINKGDKVTVTADFKVGDLGVELTHGVLTRPDPFSTRPSLPALPPGGTDSELTGSCNPQLRTWRLCRNGCCFSATVPSLIVNFRMLAFGTGTPTAT